MDALFFDFFGTLVTYKEARAADAYPKAVAVLNDLGLAMGGDEFKRAWDENYFVYHDRAEVSLQEFSMEDLVAGFFRHVDHQVSERDLHRFLRAYLEEWSSDVAPIDGVADMLAGLAERFHIGIITNTHSGEMVRVHMEDFGLTPFIETFVASDEFGSRKPCPTIFGHAVTRADARPERVLFVGDNPKADYQGAMGAGLRAVLIAPEPRHAVPDRDRISTILDLRDWLDQSL